MADKKPTRIVTPTDEPVRLSYVKLFTPEETKTGPKYSTTILIPKTATKTKALIDSAMKAALQIGQTSELKGVPQSQLIIPLHDGDGQKPKGGEYGEECKGHWVLNASTYHQRPGIVNRKLEPITDATEVYSGMYACVDLSFAPYNNVNKGIGCYINNVLKHSDGPVLAGKPRPEDSFADYADAEDDLSDIWM